MEIKDGLYQCTKCLVFQPKENFHKKKNKFGIRSVCKDCRCIERTKTYTKNKEQELERSRTYKKNNPEKRREQANKSAYKNYVWFRSFLNEIKNVPCFDCEIKYHPCAMDFDHRDPNDKLFNISDMQSRNEQIIMQEIVKCDIVCANCHRIREHNRNHTKTYYWNKIIYLYKNVPCMDCNIQFPPYVMDFDHKNPEEKLFSISKPTIQNKKEIIAEIMKCDVVCANCHRIRTFLKKEAA